MTTTPAHDARMATMTLASVYPLYLAKVERKGRSREELHEVIRWLTGLSDAALDDLIARNASFAEVFGVARLHPNANRITGMICGYRIEDITTPLTRKVRYLDRLVDELAKGRKMQKILRRDV